MINKTTVILEIIRIEGGYINDPSDSGGATKYGITEIVARDYGFTGDMKDLSDDLAFQIYEDKYWNKIKGDELLLLAPLIANECMDTAVNSGVKQAIEFLQRALNVLNNNEAYYKDLKVDGSIGSVTINALSDYLRARREIILLTAINCLQGAFYIEIAERRPKDERFVYGWLSNRIKL